MKSWIPLIMGSIIILLSACDKNNSDGIDCSNLTNALAKAWENVNVDMPNAELKEIIGDDVDADGTAKVGWSFYFGRDENSGGEGSYGIDIAVDGEVFSWNPGGYYFEITISDYNSNDAAEWIRVADEATPWVDKTLNYRELQVRSEDGDGNYYPQATDYVILFYKPNDGGEPVTYVELDADDYEILFVEPNP
ncbi:MAG: hypothetical protein JXB24_03335 [Bacteroidales bacterium]|nr:hypothetical protein [Bacteroidales bacterium]